MPGPPARLLTQLRATAPGKIVEHDPAVTVIKAKPTTKPNQTSTETVNYPA